MNSNHRGLKSQISKLPSGAHVFMDEIIGNKPKRITQQEYISIWLYDLYNIIRTNQSLLKKLIGYAQNSSNNVLNSEEQLEQFMFYKKRRVCNVCRVNFTFGDEVGLHRCRRIFKLNYQSYEDRKQEKMVIHHDDETKEQGVIRIPVIMILSFAVHNKIEAKNVDALIIIPLEDENIIDINNSFIEVSCTQKI